jgi:hypothetical protein
MNIYICIHIYKIYILIYILIYVNYLAKHHHHHLGTKIPNLPITYFPLHLLSPDSVLQPPKLFSMKNGYNTGLYLYIYMYICLLCMYICIYIYM